MTGVAPTGGIVDVAAGVDTGAVEHAVEPETTAATASWKQEARRVLAVVLLGVAAYVAYGRRHELAQAAKLFRHLNPLWLAAAIVAESLSLVVFARLQRWLLRAGGVPINLREMLEITVAGNALGTSLPGGAAWAATWAFGQLRRRGADRILAGWVILVAGALSSFALFTLLATGSWVAGSEGPLAHLRWVTAALAAIPVIVAGGYLAARRSRAVHDALGTVGRLVEDRIPGAAVAGRTIHGILERLRLVRPGPLGWTEAFGLALANWLYNATCLLTCLMALHLHVPWRGLLVIYSLTQISASLPITPGGLGVVEGSMAALLVAYHVPADQALAAVLLYRVVSFWGMVPIGWATWFWLETQARRHAHRTHPWTVHVHADGQVPGGARGPERVRRPEP
ncbi:MAG TPA: YbhN family protein, partial [Acidimicrobiales bacterium]|nr:YbhN family protein [Acidimicrobiales bacterium]